MDKKRPPLKKPDSQKLAALKSLPKETIDSFTKEELHAFLYEDVWPDSLKKKAERLYCRRRIGRLCSALFLLVLTSCAHLYFRPITPPSETVRFRQLGELPYREIWFGFVFNGEKVGFSHLKIEPIQEKKPFRHHL